MIVISSHGLKPLLFSLDSLLTNVSVVTWYCLTHVVTQGVTTGVDITATTSDAVCRNE